MQLACTAVVWIHVTQPLIGLLLVKELKFGVVKYYVKDMDNFEQSFITNADHCAETKQSALELITKRTNPWHGRVVKTSNYANLMNFINEQDSLSVENLLQRSMAQIFKYNKKRFDVDFRDIIQIHSDDHLCHCNNSALESEFGFGVSFLPVPVFWYG